MSKKVILGLIVYVVILIILIVASILISNWGARKYMQGRDKGYEAAVLDMLSAIINQTFSQGYITIVLPTGTQDNIKWEPSKFVPVKWELEIKK